MKGSLAIAATGLSLINAMPSNLEARAQPKGFDISGYQTGVNFNSAKANGAAFVIIKATEGTTYKSPQFNTQYAGATSAGLIRGGYHFAQPASSSGAAQANYFIANGGGWSADGQTLPGMLDIEYNPSGATCYGLSQSAMVSWISSFVNQYHASTTQYPLIYTTTDWWTTCTGNSAAFGSKCPLVLARYASSVGTLPAGWSYETFWQFADSGTFPGDQDLFNGDLAGLQRIAKGS